MTPDGGLVRPQTPRPAAPVICARCRVGEITYDSATCPLCGYSPQTGAVAEDPLPAVLEEAVRRELGDQLRIERPLGRGGMSVVYLAREVDLNRLVAVKVLPIQLSMGHDAVERFKREAKMGASLDHPHIVPVHRIGTTPTLMWYSMKWVKGGSLRDLLDQSGSLTVADCLRVLEPVAAALHFAHRRGVVHRDIKPANILIDDTGWVGICDFGIAKAFGASPLTHTGSTVGTPGYMAPEQCYGKPLDGRADQYALGILTYECLAGQVPFTGSSLGEIIRKHCMEPPPRITEVRPDLTPQVANALDRALRKRPEERFASIPEFVRALGGDPTRGGTLVVAVEEAANMSTLPTQPLAAPGRGSRLATWLAAPVLALAIAGTALLFRGRDVHPAPPAPQASVAAPGHLSVNSTPWGQVSVDGSEMGPTPLMDIELAPGPHRVRIARAGFEPHEQLIEIASGESVRLTGIVLERARQP